MKTYPIIVGADGTESSKAAVRWAACEAQRRHLPLTVMHVFDWEWREARYDSSHEYLDLARRRAEGITGNAVHEALTVAPDIEIDADPVIGHPAARLIAEAEHAELMVLGSRGRGGFSGLLLGSVSQRVAMHADCSVVVVRGQEDAKGAVVVGADDSPAAEHVLAVAFDEAARRRCRLIVVHAYRGVFPHLLDDGGVVYVGMPDPDAEERARLDEQLAPWRSKYPGVPVKMVCSHATAASALADESAGAQLVVVGSRGHGVIAGALVGSAGLQLMHHAQCPVYIVRPSAHQR
jgi:nucleotide-binding universal stress UspA family protein